MPIERNNEKQNIQIKGARLHNLKNIDLEIPRDKLVVITGLSGSGKSTLAFDTLYAEGQRRYVESLSSYARQFLGRINKPEVDFIKGIPPSIAIEQKVNTRNPRSTVGTSTEIYDYLKLLFARIGKTYSPVSGKLVKKHDVTSVIKAIKLHGNGTKLMILANPKLPVERSVEEHLQVVQKQGFTRVELHFTKNLKKGKTKKHEDFFSEIVKIEDILSDKKKIEQISDFYVVVDRISYSDDEDTISRLGDSIQTAFYEGHGDCIVKYINEDKELEEKYSNRFEEDGIEFNEPSDLMFSFNNPLGACPRCEGFGNVMGIDEDLVIPNRGLSIFEDAIACWKGEKMTYYKDLLVANASKFNFPIHRPINKLSPEEMQLLWKGNKYFTGLNSFFELLEADNYKIQNRVMLARYRGKTVCPDCIGTRLRKESQYVKVSEKTITDLVLMPIAQLHEFFKNIDVNEHDKSIAKRLLIEINNRLQFLKDVGLSYLTLNRLSNTLSGGESQRINLATSLGSSLVGSLYILDEPSIGLHPRDTDRLIKVLRNLQKIGNSVIVVEHDEEIMRSADQIIDIGPLAGSLGGEVVFQGNHEELIHAEKSITAKYLTGKEKIEVPKVRRKWRNNIEIGNARENNLKNISVKIPLFAFTVVTGVSGSGKSSLVKSVLFATLNKALNGYSESTGKCDFVGGDISFLKGVEFVDQNPIGRSSRSNPVTYIKAYDDIRTLYSEQQLSKINGYKPSHFSFNVDGGRCEECEGEGTVKVEMQFMADLELICESCKGHRFKDDVLEVKYHGKNIFDILNLTVDEAVEFFEQRQSTVEKRIVEKIKLLQSVGLGYVKLGQSSSTLSGGESQRIKLATYLGKEKDSSPTLFIFDEPTTGLHFHDIKKLLTAFNALIDKGHTVLVIEHNMEVIKCADWIIDMGPEGGNNGGNVVFTGTPEDLVKCKESYTGKFLKEKL